ncbi:SH3-like domain-containing protein [Streptomyces sp. CA-132043]|uniref:SH3-like domain-containing protein n=1 Tax=Streptomyces sp. CA-132043 TaxID=3240048 RepID=UPI003D9353B0
MSEPRAALFAAGQRVRVRAVDPDGHTRAPRYVRGHTGRVVEAQGRWPLADERAAGLAEPRVETVYTVAFPARELWGTGTDAHEVTVDLWESYLERVGEEQL